MLWALVLVPTQILLAKEKGLDPVAAIREDDPADTAPEEYAYATRFDGVPPEASEIDDLLRANSTAVRLADDPPATRAGLRRRAESDAKRLAQVLRSQGFYDGRVTWRIDPAAEGDGKATLVYDVALGSSYLLADVLIAAPDGTHARPVDDDVVERIGLHIGMTARAETIVDAERRLADIYRNNGYPFARVSRQRAVIDPDSKTLTVTYGVDAGDRLDFDDVAVEGTASVDPDFVRRHVTWADGDAYDQREIDETRRRLTATGLFRTVDVTPMAATGNGVPVRIAVSEREHRSIGAGLRYSTSEGPAVRALWEHRNLMSGGERLRTGATWSPLEMGVDATFRKPMFIVDRQALVADGEAKELDTDAFDERRARVFAGIDRQLNDDWAVTVGPTFEYSDVTDSDGVENTFVLLGLRNSLRLDSTDSLLDPTEGERVELSLSPYTSVEGDGLMFAAATVAGSHYLALDDERRYVLAGRAKIGAIFGEDNAVLPAGKRFYAGGGGSIRGYGFQDVGPLDEDDDPTGGRSVLELGLEMRMRVTEEIGVVPFIEGGNVYEDVFPEDLAMQWAAGLGFRYYTDIGPVRLDVAFPINRRSGVDDAFQFYISFGQAF